MAKKAKIEETEEIGRRLPKSKATEAFIERINADEEKKKTKPKTKSKKAKSDVKVKGWDPEAGSGRPGSTSGRKTPKTIRLERPVGEIVFLSTKVVDNTQHQPRSIDPEFAVPKSFVDNIRSTSGNMQAILAQKVEGMGRIQAVTIDGHRRVKAIQEINAGLAEGEKEILVKVELIECSDAEAAIYAFKANLDAERLDESDRDTWIYAMLTEYAMTTEQVIEATGLNKTTISNIRRIFEKTVPGVREAIEKGDLSTGHAKAIASLPDKEQKKALTKVTKKGLTVRETEGLAKSERGRLACIKVARDYIVIHLVKKQEPPIVREVADPKAYVSALFQKIFPSAHTTSRELGFWPRDVEVRVALRETGIKLVKKETKAKEKEVEKVSLCSTCVSHCLMNNSCIWSGVLPGMNPPKYDTCDKYLAGPPVGDRTYSKCPFCQEPIFKEGAITWHTLDGTTDIGPNLLVDASSAKIEVRHRAHIECLIDYLIETRKVTGVCKGCSNDDCELMSALKQIDPAKFEAVLEISTCGYRDDSFDLKQLITDTRNAYNALVHEQRVERKKAEEIAESSRKTAPARTAKAKAKEADLDRAVKDGLKATRDAIDKAKKKPKPRAKKKSAKKPAKAKKPSSKKDAKAE